MKTTDFGVGISKDFVSEERKACIFIKSDGMQTVVIHLTSDRARFYGQSMINAADEIDRTKGKES